MAEADVRWQAWARMAQAEARRLADGLGRDETGRIPAVASFEDGADWLVQAYLRDPADSAWLEDLARAALGREIGFTVEPVPQVDWVARSLEGLKPVAAGRFFVHGRHDRHRVPANAHALEIEAGQAFGTGHHATTVGCLTALDGLARGRRIASILDIGTGTGILAIAAAKRLRRPVVASDIDPVSTSVASANARANGVGPLVRLVTASGTHHPAIVVGAPYDLILANILAGPLVRLAPALAGLLAPRGALVLSGLLVTQERRVRAAYRAHGLVPLRCIRGGEWATLVLARPNR